MLGILTIWSTGTKLGAATIDRDLCYALAEHRPKPDDVFNEVVTDYLGHQMHVHVPESIALYPTDRDLGNALVKGNNETIQWLDEQGINPPIDDRIVGPMDDVLSVGYLSGQGIVMQGV